MHEAVPRTAFFVYNWRMSGQTVNNPSKTILFVAYYYAPAAVVGTHRIVRFTKRLPEFGWRSIVLTVDEKNYDLVDNSIKAPSDCKVYRTPFSRNKILHPKRLYNKSINGGIQEIGVQNHKKGKLRHIFQKYTSIPDTKNRWLLHAIPQAIKILRQESVNAILTTSYPYTAHIIGLILKSITGKFWLVDLRDPWVEYAFLYPRTKFNLKISMYLEKQVIKSADIIIANTLAALERMRSRYPNYYDKFECIPNGFDEDDFIQRMQSKKDNFVITHAGTIFPQRGRRQPTTFFKALSQFLNKHKKLRNKIQIRFIGHTHYSVDLIGMAKEFGVEKNVICEGYTEHSLCIQKLLSSDALLLIHHSESPIEKLYSTIPAKTYEYLGANKPILCLSSHGTIIDFINTTNSGICVDPLDTEAICQALEALYFNYNSWNKIDGASNSKKQFESRELAYRLTEILNRREKND